MILGFFATWFLLNQVDWMTKFKVTETSDQMEEKIGELYVELFAQEEIHDEELLKPIDSLLAKICEANDIDQSEIKFHLINNSIVNAMAMPDKHLVVYTGLVDKCQNEMELAGIICHELGHIEKRHIMQKLIQEVGLTVLISMTSGGGGEVVRETFKTLTSQAYSRSLEKEADIVAVDYLINANIDPEPFANFMYQMGLDRPNASGYEAWISTHPASKERAEYIIEYSKDKWDETKSAPILTTQTWDKLQEDMEAL